MKLIAATHNRKKQAELLRILQPLGIETLTADEAGVDMEHVEETGSTFEENARIKAQAAFEQSGGMMSAADDSGLMVDALDGAPGVYSARYAGEGATDAERIQKLLGELRDVPAEKRTARFKSAVCCILENGEELMAVGTCDGVIAFEPKGNGGFGYDPVFLVDGGKSYAELSAEEKDAISHRGKALRSLQKMLKEKLGESSYADK